MKLVLALALFGLSGCTNSGFQPLYGKIVVRDQVTLADLCDATVTTDGRLALSYPARDSSTCFFQSDLQPDGHEIVVRASKPGYRDAEVRTTTLDLTIELSR